MGLRELKTEFVRFTNALTNVESTNKNVISVLSGLNESNLVQAITPLDKLSNELNSLIGNITAVLDNSVELEIILKQYNADLQELNESCRNLIKAIQDIKTQIQNLTQNANSGDSMVIQFDKSISGDILALNITATIEQSKQVAEIPNYATMFQNLNQILESIKNRTINYNIALKNNRG